MQNDLAGVFLRHSATKLQQMREHIHVCLDNLDSQQIWNRGGGNENAIGNLILHVCGNARQWVISAVGGEADTRERALEFSADGNVSPEALRQRLDETVSATIAVIEQTSASRLLEEVTPQNFRVTALEAIYQVVGHFQQHTGQIIFATKAMTGRDLRIQGPAVKAK